MAYPQEVGETRSWLKMVRQGVHRSCKFIQLFLMGVIRYARAYLKLFKIISQLYLKKKLRSEVNFVRVKIMLYGFIANFKDVVSKEIFSIVILNEEKNPVVVSLGNYEQPGLGMLIVTKKQ